MDRIKIVKLIDADGKVFGVNQEGNDIIIRSKAQGYTGETFQFLRIDKSSDVCILTIKFFLKKLIAPKKKN